MCECQLELALIFENELRWFLLEENAKMLISHTFHVFVAVDSCRRYL